MNISSNVSALFPLKLLRRVFKKIFSREFILSIATNQFQGFGKNSYVC